MGVFEQESKKFCEAALTSGRIKSQQDIQSLSEYSNTLLTLLKQSGLCDFEYTEMNDNEYEQFISHYKQERKRLMGEMDEMIQNGLPILEQLNTIDSKLPDVYDKLKTYEE